MKNVERTASKVVFFVAGIMVLTIVLVGLWVIKFGIPHLM
jgi:hypothetical protein